MQEKCEEFSNRVVKLVPQEDHRCVHIGRLRAPFFFFFTPIDTVLSSKRIPLTIYRSNTLWFTPSISVLSLLSPLLLRPSVFLPITASLDNLYRELLFAMLEDVSSEYVLLALNGIGYLARYNCSGIQISDQGLGDIILNNIDDNGAYKHTY